MEEDFQREFNFFLIFEDPSLFLRHTESPFHLSLFPKTVGKLETNKEKTEKSFDQWKPLSVCCRMLHRSRRRRHHLSIFEISITHTSVPTPLSRSVPFSPISSRFSVRSTRGKSAHTHTGRENCLSRGRERAGRHFAALLAICGGGRGFKG